MAVNFDGDVSEIVTAGIALLALALSVLALWRQYRAEGRAHFTVEWEGRSDLAYINHGPGSARDVEVQLLGSRVAERRDPSRHAYVGALQVMRCHVVRLLGEGELGPLEISWRDNRRRRQTLVLDVPDQPSNPGPSPVSRSSNVEDQVRAIALDVTRKEIEQLARSAARNRRNIPPFRP